MARGLIGGAGKMSVAAASSGARVFFFLDEFSALGKNGEWDW